MVTDETPDPYILAVCPSCRTRLHPRRELAGKRVRCPDCGTAVRVPQPAAKVAAQAKVEPPPNEYRLSEPDEVYVAPVTVLAVCPRCGTRLNPRIELVGKRVRCPDCSTPVLVKPPPKETPQKKQAPIREYGVGIAPEPPPQPATTFLRSQQVVEPEPPPPPAPRWWFLSGVFGFPWHPDVIARWLTLAFFYTVSNLVGTVAFVSLPTLTGGHDVGTAFMVPFVLALGAILSIIATGFAAGCVLVVIRESAGGNAGVSDWSEAELHEGMWRLGYLLFPLITSLATGLLVFRGLEPYSPDGATVASAAAVVFTFPLMLLSTVEYGSPFALVSGEALRLIAGYWWGWLGMLVEATLVTTGWVAICLVVQSYSPYAAAIVSGLLGAAVTLINARLLGRFVQRAGEVIERRRERRQAAAAAADDGESHDVDE